MILHSIVLVGGNKLMLTMLQDYSAALGVNAKDFSAVLAETEGVDARCGNFKYH